jgi:hypothetical protein
VRAAIVARAAAGTSFKQGDPAMKNWTKMMAALALAVIVGAYNANAADPAKPDAPAKPDKPAKPAKAKKDQIKGSVVKVDGSTVVISAGKKTEAKEVTIATDEKTVVTIEGKAAKLADLKPGQKVTITPETGTALTIEVPAPKAKKDKDAK